MVNREDIPRRAKSPGRRAWAAPSEVEVGTGVAQQLALMKALVAGEISAPDFAKLWLAARRRSLDEGERVRDKFERILTNVFYLLDDYAIDPSLRGPGDISDETLKNKVDSALDELSQLDDD